MYESESWGLDSSERTKTKIKTMLFKACLDPGSIPGRNKRFVYSSQCLGRLWGPLSLLVLGVLPRE
jgi:hypothetical protein